MTNWVKNSYMRSLSVERWFCWCALCFIPFMVNAQDSLNIQSLKTDTVLSRSTVADSSGQITMRRPGFVRRFVTKGYPNPRRAALFSAIIPGGGQAYNRSWWKIPVVYGALGGLTYAAVVNGKEYRTLADNYKRLVDRDPNNQPTEQPYASLDAATLKGYRDQWRVYTERSYIFLGLTYLLSITDAFVDAHLNQFDTSDDLTFRLQPDTKAVPGFGATFGMGLVINF